MLYVCIDINRIYFPYNALHLIEYFGLLRIH